MVRVRCAMVEEEVKRVLKAEVAAETEGSMFISSISGPCAVRGRGGCRRRKRLQEAEEVAGGGGVGWRLSEYVCVWSEYVYRCACGVAEARRSDRVRARGRRRGSRTNWEP